MTYPIAKPVAIIGAGLAGLTAAACLERHKIPFILFESNSKLAGLAVTTRDEEGFCYDVGAHFITNRLAAAIGIEKECEPVARYGESVYLKQRFYSYPIGLLRQWRYVQGALRARLAGLFRREPPVHVAAWFRRQFGAALANEVAIPLAEAWSGVSAEDLSPAVGEKLPEGI